MEISKAYCKSFVSCGALENWAVQVYSKTSEQFWIGSEDFAFTLTAMVHPTMCFLVKNLLKQTQGKSNFDWFDIHQKVRIFIFLIIGGNSN